MVSIFLLLYICSKPKNKQGMAKKLPLADERKLDYYFQYPFDKRDTTIIKLTTTLETEILPKEKEINTAYGYYSSKSWLNNRMISKELW